MKLSLKICGMRDAENIQQVAALAPDYMGFIFYDRSPRFVGENFMLPTDFPASIKRVGVFVNAAVEDVIATVNRLSLQYVQLHGKESVEYCQQLKVKGIGIIKAFSVDADFDFEVTKLYADVVDYFLFDTKGKYHGGNGQLFDWSLLAKYDQRVPFFLSGGLSPDNIGSITALKDMNLYALDVNSGVEDEPGVKNIDRVSALVHAMK